MKKVRRGYYVLRLISAFYKVCAIVSLIFAALGACGLIVSLGRLPEFFAQYGLASIPAIFLAGIVLVLVFAGLPALNFWVIASVLDIIVNVNFKTEIILALMLKDRNDIPPPTKPERIDEAENYVRNMRERYRN